MSPKRRSILVVLNKKETWQGQGSALIFLAVEIVMRRDAFAEEQLRGHNTNCMLSDGKYCFK